MALLTTPPIDIVKTRFLGASVSSVSSTAGWNENSSAIEVILVEDRNEVFEEPTPGDPVVFEIGSLHFEGIVTNWRKNNTPTGITYTVRIADPRVILEAAQVILNNYAGARLDYPNLLDVYGYYERQGFGLSGANEGGMRWSNVKTALTQLMPVKFKGHNYTVNFDGLPVPPSFYRVGGGSSAVSLLQLINDIAADSGYQYIVQLFGDEIRFKSVSLRDQPGLTFVRNFISSQGSKSSYSSGLELIQGDAYTTAVIFGGNVEEMYTDGQIAPYWGRSANGSIIIGGRGENGIYGVVDSTSVFDIINDTSYRIEEIELRCALIDQSCWASYIFKNKPDIAENVTGFRSEYEIPETIQNPLGHIDTLNDSVENAKKISNLNSDAEDGAAKFKRFYDFVHNIASTYYGRMFLVPLNFLQRKIEEETGSLVYSHQTTSSAYFNGSALGLSSEFADLFQDDTGKFVPFCKFPNAVNATNDTLDVTKVSADNTVIQGRDAFIKCDVSDVFNSNGQNYVVITLSDIAYASPEIILGDFEALKFAYGIRPAQEEFIKKMRIGGNTPLKIHPRAVTPSQVAIPLINNTSTYGPWVISNGLEGKVYFEQSSDLTPWNYGGYANMEQAALARISDKVIGLQDVETGQVEVAGLPAFNLGDSLYGTGPTITSIDIRVEQNSVTTVYSMQTYTPKFGAFSRQNSDRLNRMNRNNVQNIREIKQAKRSKKAKQQIISNTAANNQFLGKQPESQRVKGSNTHTVIAGFYVDGEDGQRNAVSTSSSEDALANLSTHESDLYKYTAAVDQTYFFRPISFNKDAEFSHTEIPESGAVRAHIAVSPTARDLCPYKDYETAKTTSNLVTWGEEYAGLNLLKREDTFDPETVRAMALRGPIMVCAWGYDLFGDEVPEDKQEIKEWRVGPLDVRWDASRKVWTSPVLVPGVTNESIPAGEKGRVKLTSKYDGETGKLVEALNWFEGDIESGYRCFIVYVAGLGLCIVNMDCSPAVRREGESF